VASPCMGKSTPYNKSLAAFYLFLDGKIWKHTGSTKGLRLCGDFLGFNIWKKYSLTRKQ
jgi:hypothetical protein